MVFLSYTLILAIVLTTVVFAFTSNQLRLTSIPSIVWKSFTTVDALSAQPRGSLGMAMLLLLTVITGGAIAFHEARRAESEPPKSGWYLRAALVFALAVIGIPLAVAAAKADLVQIGKPVWDIIARWYLAFFPLVLLLAAALYRPDPAPARFLKKETSWAYVLLAVAAVFVIWNANGVLIKADIIYQQGYMLEQDYLKNAGKLEPQQRLQVLDRVRGMYSSAIQQAPSEDFYYLALARVYQQVVPLVEDAQQKAALLQEGIATVEKARAIYPLNVDHTANMGRFYRTWAQEISDPTDRLAKLQLAADYYAEAVQLSPNKAHLYNEWALTYYLMGAYENAQAKLEKSLSLDSQFDQTYLLLGQLYTQTGEWAKAEEMYRRAVDMNPGAVESISMLGYVLDQQGKTAEAIEQNLRVLELAPQDYVTIRNLSVLYNKANDHNQALAYARLALSLAPDADKAGLQQFIEQLEALVAQK